MKSILLAAIAASAFTGAALAAPVAGAGVAPAAGAYDPRDLAGVWTQATAPTFGPFPLTPAYDAILKQRIEDEKAGRPYVHAGNPCVPAPLVGMMVFPTGPLEFATVHDDRLVIAKSNGSIYRVYFNRPHPAPEDVEPSMFGDSVGRWEGDTLVIDTIGLGGSGDIDGKTPHSDATHVVQRIRRVAFDKLEDRMTVEDPIAFTRPANSVVTYNLTPKIELAEFYCTNDRMRYDPDGKVSIAPPR
ncbi:MAG TPA: hypothetical protein VL460_08205 [Caulobacteraceae bacterium]|jgi:hypothetical protein|nr:hypothetical protein [Caulobacteraceae bacterium]